eukprot:CAMPEP_0194449992 /NCGR_PEP_ID=MMETSP0176-20130528/130465_1 /TAXON_ID=216777 /ORGANISM="Proboscia alata, Strain PI-D3" /LENGTH=378 /DNA_ID=CAMNT_0039277205 /DNA_START=142 /DNA_END=1278 /DNA_ORIENTATION=-
MTVPRGWIRLVGICTVCAMVPARVTSFTPNGIHPNRVSMRSVTLGVALDVETTIEVPCVRPPLFQHTNVHVVHTDVPGGIWDAIVPKKNRGLSLLESLDLPFFGKVQRPNSNPDTPIDVSVTFTDPTVGARQLLNACDLPSAHPAVQQLSECLSLYQTVWQQSLLHSPHHPAKPACVARIVAWQSSLPPQSPHSNAPPPKPACVARIVASRGSRGTKCPRWHVDHVPLRLICALKGPGVVYLDESAEFNPCEDHCGCGNGGMVVDRRVLNDCQETDTRKANALILVPNDGGGGKEGGGVRAMTAGVGECVLLVGKRWQDGYTDDYDYDEADTPSDATAPLSQTDGYKEVRAPVLAAVHKSPVLGDGDGRVLLTVDIAV